MLNALMAELGIGCIDVLGGCCRALMMPPPIYRLHAAHTPLLLGIIIVTKFPGVYRFCADWLSDSFPARVVRPWNLLDIARAITRCFTVGTIIVDDCLFQRCSLGLERLGLEAVLRRFFGTSRLVSVLRVQRLGLVSVLKI